MRNRCVCVLFVSVLFLLSLLAAAPASRADEAAKTYRNTIGMEFMLIPAGTFQMGCTPETEEDCKDEERPRHEVRISKPFYLGKYEVTQAEWEAVMGNNPSHDKNPDCPVETVSWEDAQKFIAKLNAKEGHQRYRLPTEAEWEYAARAGSGTAFSFGDDPGELGNYAWWHDNSGDLGRPHPVGQKRPNAWGLYDMHGNVLEWVQDRWGKYGAEAATDPQGPDSGEKRVLRSCGANFAAKGCRSAVRGDFSPDFGTMVTGFRVALSLEECGDISSVPLPSFGGRLFVSITKWNRPLVPYFRCSKATFKAWQTDLLKKCESPQFHEENFTLSLFCSQASTRTALKIRCEDPQLEQRLEAGDPKALFTLHHCYYCGDSVPQDRLLADYLLREAADKGSAEALHLLGELAASSIELAFDREVLRKAAIQAQDWWRKAAERFRAAAEEGDEDAQYRLGMMYSKGQGMQEDEEKALAWWRKAAAQGHMEAKTRCREADERKEQGKKAETGRVALKSHTNSIGMEFLLIPAGDFMMGCDEKTDHCEDRELPRHKVTISKPFYLGKHEVTQAQWQAVMGWNPSHFDYKGPDHPVENVTWEDAQSFIDKLNAKEGHQRYRLPTEAEWEYAARAGTTTRWSFGDDEGNLDAHAWYHENSGDGLGTYVQDPRLVGCLAVVGNTQRDPWTGYSTHPVGRKKPNAWGLHDMHGNVAELVQDRLGEYGAEHVVDPVVTAPGEDEFLMVARGGTWWKSARVVRTAIRTGISPNIRNSEVGFRLALTPEN